MLPKSSLGIVAFLTCLQQVAAIHPWTIARRSQVAFSSDGFSPQTFPSAGSDSEHDIAGKPNIATRIEVTSEPNATLFCATDEDKFVSGYAHFTNHVGVEDKHMFWWLFEAREDSANAPVVVVFGGGPGSSGMFMPFNGAGPCILTEGGDGNGTAIPSQYPWTRHVNLLAIDHPVGVGFSYGVQSSFRNSSERAAWDVDDFLQAFWTTYPHFAKNQFMIQSASYGGTYIPHIVNVIHSRNIAAQNDSYNKTRILKMPDAVAIGNGWSDPVTNHRWSAQTNCVDQLLANETECAEYMVTVPACLDSLQFAYEQPTLKHQLEAQACIDGLQFGSYALFKNPYDTRQTCKIWTGIDDCFPQMGWLNHVMARTDLRQALGVPDHVKFIYLAEETIEKPFVMNGDLIQPAYKLLASAIDAGLRVLIYNGNRDAVCSWRSNLAWMGLLQTVHQTAFRAAKDEPIPGVGWQRRVGEGAGVYTFVSIDEAGHFVEWNQPKVFRDLLIGFLNNETFVDAVTNIN